MWLLETENYMHGLHLIYTKQHGVESTVDERWALEVESVEQGGRWTPEHPRFPCRQKRNWTWGLFVPINGVTNSTWGILTKRLLWLLLSTVRSDCPAGPAASFTFCLEKAMAPHSSTLAWKIPWTEGPSGLQSIGSLRVRHDWATSLSLFTFMHWRRKWQPTPVFLPGESQGRGSLMGCRLWGRTELDTTEVT